MNKYTYIDYLSKNPYKLTTCPNYVVSSLDDKLKNSLSEIPFVFITGKPGNGKTQLAANYINQLNGAHKTPIIKLNKKALWNLFSNTTYNERKERASLLVYETLNAKKTADSTAQGHIIILCDIPYLTSKYCNIIENIPLPENAYLIVTTRSYIKPQTFPVISVNKRSFDDLKNIYLTTINSEKDKDSTYNISLDDDELKRLFQIVDNNVMMISLVAKSLCNNKKSFITKEKLLDSQNWLWKTLNLPQVYDSYTDTFTKTHHYKTGITTHALAMFSNFPKDFYEETAPILCIWAGNAIPKEWLVTYASLKEYHISFAIGTGILCFADTSHTLVKMNPFFFKVFWRFYLSNTIETNDIEMNNVETDPIEANTTTIKRQSFCKKFNVHFSMNLDFCLLHLNKIQSAYLYSSDLTMTFQKFNAVMLTALKHINEFLNVISNDKRVTNKTHIFQSWNLYLIDFINFNLDRGNTETAQNHLPSLFISFNKHGQIQKRPTSFQNLIIDLINNKTQTIQSNTLIASIDQSVILNKHSYPRKNDHKAILYILKYSQILYEDYLNQIIRAILIHTLTPYYSLDDLYCMTYGFQTLIDKYKDIQSHEFLKEYTAYQPNDSTQPQKYYYYLIALACMQGLITLDYTWVKSAYETYEQFKRISSPSSELQLKAEILLLNCLLIMNYKPIPYIANEIDPKKTEAHMTNIFCSYRSSMTFDTSILYFIIRIKYLCLYEDGSSYAQCKGAIVKEIGSFIELVNSDWSINNKYKKEALQLLNHVRQLLLDC